MLNQNDFCKEDMRIYLDYIHQSVKELESKISRMHLLNLHYFNCLFIGKSQVSVFNVFQNLVNQFQSKLNDRQMLTLTIDENVKDIFLMSNYEILFNVFV